MPRRLMNLSLTQVWRQTSAFCLDFGKLERPDYSVWPLPYCDGMTRLVSVAEIRAAADAPARCRRPYDARALSPVVAAAADQGRIVAAGGLIQAPRRLRGHQRPAARRGVVVHSSGNHGYAVAYAAALLGAHAVIVVPETAPATKTAAITACGAELVMVAPTMAARQAAADDLAAARPPWPPACSAGTSPRPHAIRSRCSSAGTSTRPCSRASLAGRVTPGPGAH